MARLSKGRKKTVMKKMSKESNLLGTFSKRRSGLFKKASELCTLCGVEMAIIVFSPTKKVFSFGNPNVQHIIDKFLNSPNPSSTNSTTDQLVEADRIARAHELNMQLYELLNQLEVQKNHGEELMKLRKKGQAMFWWEAPIDDLGFEQLEKLKTGMEDLKRNIAAETQKVVAGSSIGLPMTPLGCTQLGYGSGHSLEYH